jgi:hypothetical protein
MISKDDLIRHCDSLVKKQYMAIDYHGDTYKKGYQAALNLFYPLVEALEFYKDMAIKKNHILIFDNEKDSRGEVYEKYKEYSIGAIGVKAASALHDLERKVKGDDKS